MIIDSVFLYLYEDTEDGDPNIYVKRVASFWDDAVVTWTLQPSYGEPYSTDTLNAKNSGNWWKLNIKPIFEAYYNSTYVDSGYAVFGVQSDNTTTDRLQAESSEHGTAVQRPYIVVGYHSAVLTGILFQKFIKELSSQK